MQVVFAARMSKSEREQYRQLRKACRILGEAFEVIAKETGKKLGSA